MFEKRRKEIAARRAEIRALLAGEGAVDMDALEKELDALDAEERDLDRREAATRRLNGGAGLEGRNGQQGGHGDRGSGDEGGGDPTPGPVNPIAGGGENRSGLPVGLESRAAYLADLQGIEVRDVETRAQRFAEGGRMEITTDALFRSLTLSGGNIAQPTRVSGINPGQNIVSGIVDMVRVVDANGMGEDSVAYEVSGGQTAAVKKDDGTAPTPTDPALSDSTTAAGSYCMAYGKPLAYQLDLFGPYTVEVSRDYKFAEGLLAVMGEAMIGGNVITENGFLRIKNKAAAGG